MNVQETVFRMMRTFPTLYRSRAMALGRLFDSYDAVWVNGELIDKEAHAERDFLPYPDENADENGRPVTEREILYRRRRNAKAQFVYDNAELMSRDTMSSFGKHSSIRFEGKAFKTIPADITTDWLDAAKELASIVSIHRYYPDTSYAAEYLKQQQDELEKSKKICVQFLERFKVITICPYERAARLEKVTAEAQALGFMLVPVEPATLVGTVTAP